ncbi:hypothetical protein [Actomonas aquatica]|uniref:DUF2017 domain-containing protein n=1 Tax=Actomonas aquatica TaxID=2866162 RepID=A0ABZ1CAE1_9BACT|nr:hypothetical protein [Opitutus sp. WL0086]WRQ88441.1 hypothetical protein K1X11_003435 [Opitutus sp. WL0086]
MKRIEVKLSLGVVAPLLDVIKSVADSLDDSLAAPQALERVDAELRDTWRSELVAGQNGDVATLLALFDSDFFANGIVNFDEDNGDAILRACSAVRLRLRERYLQHLPDEELESGDIDLEELQDDTQRAFMCYLFLATVQELIIEHLSGNASRSTQAAQAPEEFDDEDDEDDRDDDEEDNDFPFGKED